jgi:hypothetical protein
LQIFFIDQGEKICTCGPGNRGQSQGRGEAQWCLDSSPPPVLHSSHSPTVESLVSLTVLFFPQIGREWTLETALAKSQMLLAAHTILPLLLQWRKQKQGESSHLDKHKERHVLPSTLCCLFHCYVLILKNERRSCLHAAINVNKWKYLLYIFKIGI